MIGIHFSPGYSDHSWRPAASSVTNTAEYWLNWRVLLCSIWIIFATVMAGILIRRYEGLKSTQESGEEAREKAVGSSSKEESWRPCLKEIHPAWLLIYRALAFLLLLALLITTLYLKGGQMFCYYTQWTFASVTLYFGIGSLLSVCGCYELLKNDDDDISSSTKVEAGSAHRNLDDRRVHRIAAFLGCSLQIIFQMNAGAVMLTDLVFWVVIVPFLATKNYSLNFIMIGMHSVNAIFVFGEAALNSLKFPWFRISYFFLWTVTYVIFQWILHASIKIWWPYPFLDMSSPFSPMC
ncbi:uncharacterized protein LOC144709444 isoform X2 [Wolffia australiana]